MVIKPPMPISSFLSTQKDMNLIFTAMLKNERLKKLLHYTTKDCLSKNKISLEESLNFFGKEIRIVPKLYVDNTVLNYIVVRFDDFFPNFKNPEFRDNKIEFDILCHYDQWDLGDFQLRPYMIAAEIDSMFNEKHLTGIGLLEFESATQIVVSDEFAGLCLKYKAIHGDEDKKKQTTPEKEEMFLQDFKDFINSEI